MKFWYQNLTDTDINYGITQVFIGQKIWLTKEEAESYKGKLKECNPPVTILNCARPEDHAFWQQQKNEGEINK